eukprot:CAMPEP_0202902464 /NCGR_PEP_ID=MMETSP1392-20130828/16864_1 /ASSEMBLY_ACC=CAM_ASM_000868 /TAXON_ID=225041 /ORGANISM="Chlamydomonas chlamydogama, Strain SAG 11-48b" /LENGTH=1205 /DNA_ID=CAMNT_0049589227 /DNA_START=175 /DNA_END=3794 /DNA_ORIENTATION=-
MSCRQHSAPSPKKHTWQPAIGTVAFASTVPLTVSVRKQVKFGEVLKVVGNIQAFGDWNIDGAPTLTWNDGHHWKLTTEVPVGFQVKFKFVKVGKSGSDWESGHDRELTALGPEYGLKASCEWNQTEATSVEAYKLEPQEVGAGRSSSPSKQAVAAGGWSVSGSDSGSNGNGSFGSQGSNNGTYNSNGSNNGSSRNKNNGRRSRDGTLSLSSFEEEARGSTGSWVGAAPEFVRSRKKDGERQGVWNTNGLEGVALELVKGDKEASNWLSKLGLQKRMLVDRKPRMRPGVDELAYCYVYATWINTGAIQCAETGGHHRPNHHANLALQMFRSLEWSIGDTIRSSPPSPEEAAADVQITLAARRMHSRLPSFSGEFRQSVPLTRIRDIAHRNDIPKDLKDEIKHTLQNKLHRSAGPEDLVASEAMLKRITAKPGEFNASFVEEFKIFIRELRDFFNASTLVELLDSSKDAVDEPHAACLGQFRTIMSRVEAASNPPLDDLMSLLFIGTQLRTFYAAGLSAGLRNDVPDDALVMRQRWRLAEIRLEEYCFVVLSRIINVVEQQGGAGKLARSNNQVWAIPFAALTAGLRHLGLSQFNGRELLSLENELQAWHSSTPLVETREAALRAKASVDRVMRLAGEYSDAVMRVFDSPAARLGNALGLPPHMANVFGESEVRSSMAFQVSKLATMMSKALRASAGMDAWDGLVTGECVGQLVEVDSLSPEALSRLPRQLQEQGAVLSVKASDGDEEIGPLVPLGLRGVVLRQDLPHLSHLGVRARQEQVPFATCDDAEHYGKVVKPLLGKLVRLAVTPEGVKLEAAPAGSRSSGPSAVASSSPRGSQNGEASTSGWQASISRSSLPTVVPLASARLDTCGSKSTKCAELERMAAASGNLFRTAQGCCLPFGTMETVIERAGPIVSAQYKTLLDKLGSAEGAALDEACNSMQGLLKRLSLPQDLISKISSTFDRDTMLAVRSSANVEDLAGMSAAGLYESVVGVPANNAAEVSLAVATVWASLYTRRAVLSRRVAGVPQPAACMSVLIQELHVPELSFVLHTARPSDGNRGVLLAEVAPGQGETLASGARGTPWRFEVDKAARKIRTMAFANFSKALTAPPRGRTGLMSVDVDYSKQRLSTDESYRQQVVLQLSQAGSLIEEAFQGVPQDVEGGLVPVQGPGGKIESYLYVFQHAHSTRPTCVAQHKGSAGVSSSS